MANFRSENSGNWRNEWRAQNERAILKAIFHWNDGYFGYSMFILSGIYFNYFLWVFFGLGTSKIVFFVLIFHYAGWKVKYWTWISVDHLFPAANLKTSLKKVHRSLAPCKVLDCKVKAAPIWKEDHLDSPRNVWWFLSTKKTSSYLPCFTQIQRAPEIQTPKKWSIPKGRFKSQKSSTANHHEILLYDTSVFHHTTTEVANAQCKRCIVNLSKMCKLW